MTLFLIFLALVIFVLILGRSFMPTQKRRRNHRGSWQAYDSNLSILPPSSDLLHTPSDYVNDDSYSQSSGDNYSTGSSDSNESSVDYGTSWDSGSNTDYGTDFGGSGSGGDFDSGGSTDSGGSWE